MRRTQGSCPAEWCDKLGLITAFTGLCRVGRVATLQRGGGQHYEWAIVGALTRFDELWASLFPAEQARITRLLVSRVTVGSAGIAVDLRHHGVGSLVRDLTAPKTHEAAGTCQQQ